MCPTAKTDSYFNDESRITKWDPAHKMMKIVGKLSVVVVVCWIGLGFNDNDDDGDDDNYKDTKGMLVIMYYKFTFREGIGV